MAHAYTPGLKVTDNNLVRKNRILPLKGKVVVKVGDKVKPDDVVARTELPGNVVPLNVANKLGIPPEDIHEFMVKKEGDSLEEGDVIAIKKFPFIKSWSTTCKSPVTGSVESVSGITGQVLLRGLPIPVEVKAYIKGEVTEVIPEEGVVVACTASFVQGIFGIGGETFGTIQAAVPDNTTVLSDKLISEDMAGKVVIGGSLVTSEALNKAIEVGAKGIVVGGFDDKDLRDFLGYDIGVAITGSEDKGITLVVTEGFGQINMAQKTFELLKAHEGQMACINGATQIRAGVIRPEIIIPIDESLKGGSQDEKLHLEGLTSGLPVRIIGPPYFGAIGHVTELPIDLQTVETESKVRVLEVELEDGNRVTVPRANVELIEE